jgi:hypothetical protein
LLLFASVACTRGNPPDPVPPDPGTAFFIRQACKLPQEQLIRTWNGYYPGRSGDIQIVPREPNTVGNWFSHAGPWDYLQDVPMFVYGPGQVPPLGRVARPVTMADVAPTMARLVGFDFDAPDGSPMREALPTGTAQPAPRLVVAVVWDSVGDNVLATHPDSWPTLRSLIPEGVWFENATAGSSPSITGPVHASLGTGAWARRHGSIDHWFRLNGRMAESERVGPDSVLVPSMADLYDRARDNQPVIGVSAYNGWHLAMAGHGSSFPGGDRDVGITVVPGTKRWGLSRVNEPFFGFPSYVRDVPAPDEREIDGADGALDGRLRGDARLLEGLRWTLWQRDVLREVIRGEKFGSDSIPDLLFINVKRTDDAGHIWTMNSPEMATLVRASDAALADLIRVLNREVGPGRWVLLLTADHGSTPKIEVSGGFQIEESLLREDLLATFDRDGDDRPSIMLQRPSQVWVDRAELEANGFTLEQVARYLGEYTKSQNRQDPGFLKPEERDDRVFAAAFPSALLDDLPCLPT